MEGLFPWGPRRISGPGPLYRAADLLKGARLFLSLFICNHANCESRADVVCRKGDQVRLERPPIGLRYYAPSPPLRSVISSYYCFHANLPFYADLMRADLPQIRFMLAGHGHYVFSDGATMVTPDVAIIGPTFGSTRFEVTGPLLVLGIGLLPAGWAALVREDASSFADRVDDAVALFGGVMSDALDQMATKATIERCFAIVDGVMRILFARMEEPPLWFTRLTDHWLSETLSPEVDRLVAAIGMSGRQVERLAKRVYGAPPKMLARKYRALKAASLLASQRSSWQEVAGDAFFDQSHFIREFKQFTGLTPTQMMNDPSPVTRLTFERRKLTDILPPLIRIS